MLGGPEYGPYPSPVTVDELVLDTQYDATGHWHATDVAVRRLQCAARRYLANREQQARTHWREFDSILPESPLLLMIGGGKRAQPDGLEVPSTRRRPGIAHWL